MKYEIVSKRLKEAMNDMNISAAELSKRSGVGKSAISHYYNGSHCPHNENAVLLAEVLNVEPTWLMGFNVPKNKTKLIISNGFIDYTLDYPDIDNRMTTIEDLYYELSEENKQKFYDAAMLIMKGLK